MTEDEATKFVTELNLVIAHTEQLTDELATHLQYIADKVQYLVDAFNK